MFGVSSHEVGPDKAAGKPLKRGMNSDMTSIAIFGCGYLGQRVAELISSGGGVVHAVTRSHQNADGFRGNGWQPIVADITNPDTLDRLPGDLAHTSHILFAVGFDRTVGIPIEEVYVAGLKNVLERLPKFSTAEQRFVYVSSTGVYGQSDGEWVDENSPCEPVRVGGQACLAAEKILQQSEFGAQSVILRMAGIYGPGRLPRKKDLLKDREITAASTGYLNLIHVDDAAATVVAAFNAAAPARFVVSDGNPVLRVEYYRELADQLNIEEFKIHEVDAHSPAGQRARASKRIRAERFIAELRMNLQYPNYKIGLQHAIRVEGDLPPP